MRNIFGPRNLVVIAFGAIVAVSVSGFGKLPSDARVEGVRSAGTAPPPRIPTRTGCFSWARLRHS